MDDPQKEVIARVTWGNKQKKVLPLDRAPVQRNDVVFRSFGTEVWKTNLWSHIGHAYINVQIRQQGRSHLTPLECDKWLIL